MALPWIILPLKSRIVDSASSVSLSAVQGVTRLTQATSFKIHCQRSEPTTVLSTVAPIDICKVKLLFERAIIKCFDAVLYILPDRLKCWARDRYELITVAPTELGIGQQLNQTVENGDCQRRILIHFMAAYELSAFGDYRLIRDVINSRLILGRF